MSVSSNASMAMKMDKLGVPADVQRLALDVQNAIKDKNWIDVSGNTVTVDIAKDPGSIFAKFVNLIKKYGASYQGASNFTAKDAKAGNVDFMTYAASIANATDTKWKFMYGAPFPYRANKAGQYANAAPFGVGYANMAYRAAKGLDKDQKAQKAFTKGASDLWFTNFGTNKQIKNANKQLKQITVSTLQDPVSAVKSLEQAFNSVYGNMVSNPDPSAEQTLGQYLYTVANYVKTDKTPNKDYTAKFIGSALGTTYLKDWLLQSYSIEELQAMSGDAKETLVSTKKAKDLVNQYYNNGGQS